MRGSAIRIGPRNVNWNTGYRAFETLGEGALTGKESAVTPRHAFGHNPGVATSREFPSGSRKYRLVPPRAQ